jgi:anti-anti-sigma factor
MISQPFSVQIRRQAGTVVLDLAGEINASAETPLNAAYTEAEKQTPPTILINFTQTGFINSTGIALIVALLSQARKAHCRLVVYGLSEHYLEIFHITRLADFMTIVPDETSALAEVPDRF